MPNKAKHYYKKASAGVTEKAVRDFLRKSKGIVHGARATNAFLPDYLDKSTEDWDIFVTGNPDNAAKRLEALLDARYGGNYFEVKHAIHPGTFSVVSLVTKRVVADITIPERHIDFRTLNGINVATLDYHVQQIQKTLKDPEAAFRHDKDRETLQRINIAKRDAKTSTFPPYQF